MNDIMKKSITIIGMLLIIAILIVISHFRQRNILNEMFEKICFSLDHRPLSRTDQNILWGMLSFGAATDVDSHIMSPVEIALTGRNDALLKYLLAYKPKPRIDLSVNWPVSRYGMKELLRLGKQPDFHDEHGNTLLHLHARWPESDAMPELLSRSLADPNAVNHRGYTPLHIACGCNTIAAVKELLQYNAKVNVASYRGYTPLHMAVGRKDPDILMIGLLLDQGAEINAVDAEGNSALFFARWYGKPEVVDLLLSRGANAGWRNWQNQTYLGAQPPQMRYLGVF